MASILLAVLIVVAYFVIGNLFIIYLSSWCPTDNDDVHIAFYVASWPITFFIVAVIVLFKAVTWPARHWARRDQSAASVEDDDPFDIGPKAEV